MAPFTTSLSVFDLEGRLVEWNAGFIAEFEDAASIIAVGVHATAICAACLLPKKLLNPLQTASTGTPTTTGAPSASVPSPSRTRTRTPTRTRTRTPTVTRTRTRTPTPVSTPLATRQPAVVSR